MVKMTKSKTFQAYLPNCHRTYSCVHCRAHLANHDELISKASVCWRDQGPQRRGAWTLPGVPALTACSPWAALWEVVCVCAAESWSWL